MTACDVRQISISQWRTLADQGTVLPMQIPLDGDSMRPLVRRNRDLVSIVPLARPLKRGDVVLFEMPKGRYVVHRVRKIRQDRLQTLGDHCWNPDAWMPPACVLGLAVQVKRDNRLIPLDRPLSRALGILWMSALPLRKLYWRTRAAAGKILRKLGWRR